MRREEINKMYSDAVAKYLAEGYVIDPILMSGMETSEITKVVMRKDDKVLIVALRSFYETFKSGIIFACGFYKKPLKSRNFDTVWFDHFDYFEEHKFYSLNHDRMHNCDDVNHKEWFVTKEELDAIYAKSRERAELRLDFSNRTQLSHVPVSILRRVNSIWGFKRVKASDIRIERYYSPRKTANALQYQVFANGKLAKSYIYYKSYIY